MRRPCIGEVGEAKVVDNWGKRSRRRVRVGRLVRLVGAVTAVEVKSSRSGIGSRDAILKIGETFDFCELERKVR